MGKFKLKPARWPKGSADFSPLRVAMNRGVEIGCALWTMKRNEFRAPEKWVVMPKAFFGSIAAAMVLAASQATAQTMNNKVGSTATNSAPILTRETAEKAWSFSASAYTYIVPDSREYVQPTFTADRDWLHLEARYNYEGLNTGSAWVGFNWSVGDQLSFEFTPMIGGVFGDTTGIAPGYKASLNYWKLSLSTEGELLFDTGGSSESFFYNWSELTLAPTGWFRFGAAIQRTRLYETDLDIQRGFLVGFSLKKVDLTTYVFNPADQPTFVLGVSFSF